MATDNFGFYLQNRLIQTSQTGGQRYSDTSPFSIPCLEQCSFNVDDVIISVCSKSEGMGSSNFEFVQLIIRPIGQSS